MTEPTVFIVDDDAAVRDALALLLDAAGLPARCFASADDFLAEVGAATTGCLVLDVHMPGRSGPELQAELLRRGIPLPVIFLTAHGDIPTTVQAIRAGAVDFLTKPVDARVLLERVQQACAHDRRERERRRADAARVERLAGLTPRERDVLSLALGGLPNKEIGRRLGISHRTVEVYRSRILSKTGAPSLLALVALTNGDRAAV